ncbi:MAG: hypothetical protein Q9187_005594 [Circinaria calcarea]
MPAWEQLSINKPHVAYMIIGGFTSLFMLVSLFVKERLYIGEATVATICGIIFGPHAANLFDPRSWGNADLITLECSRIVLVVQCFAIGVELPKAYMERHWRSVTFLLVPVMAYGWLITSLFIWWMIEPLTWLESLCIAACVTATDPVLASSVVGKGKFAKRIPKHLRDLLSAESGCNDGMAFPFIYLSLYLLRYRPHASEVAFHWICFTILYECVFGAVYGVLIGYFGRHAIKWADSKGIIDRESFLVFYFVLALFCAGSGSLLGLDDLLVGFAAGVGFSNDGWFTQKTEESHVSNVIDLLLNLAYFVFLGSLIPWSQFNAPDLGITPWRLVVIAILVVFFRRIPIMLALKPLVPDIKNWREALFAGHFGPIGVGAIFAAILTRAELEHETTEPLAVLPGPGEHNYIIIQVIWPITAFLVITSIIVHGSSIAVFTLGKRINTLSLTMSYTQANEDGHSWMNRLPRIQSTAKTSMSKGKGDFESTDTSAEKLPEYPPGTLPPVGLPGNFLRRQKEEDNPSNNNSRASSLRPTSRRKRWDSGLGPGGPISQSAITPQRRANPISRKNSSGSNTVDEKGNVSPEIREKDVAQEGLEMQEVVNKNQENERNRARRNEPVVETYQEGDEIIIEDEEGTVLNTHKIDGETEDQQRKHVADVERALEKDTSGEYAKGKFHQHEKTEGEEIEHAIASGLEHPNHAYRNLRKKMGDWHGFKHKDSGVTPKPKATPEHRRGPAHAYQYGNTIIVEDEDGEVVKKYDIPTPEKKRPQAGKGVSFMDAGPVRDRLHRVGTWAHLGNKGVASGESRDATPGGVYGQDAVKKRNKPTAIDDDDDRIRFTVNAGGRRMSKADFIRQIQQLDPKARCEVLQESDVHDDIKQQALQEAKEHHTAKQQQHSKALPTSLEQSESFPFPDTTDSKQGQPQIQRVATHEDRPAGDEGLTLVDSNGEDVPFHSVSDTLSKYSAGQPETAAQRRRRLASSRRDSDDDGTERIPPLTRQTLPQELVNTASGPILHHGERSSASAGETNAERRRRLAALRQEDGGKDSDSDDDGGERRPDPDHRPIEEPSQPGNGRMRTSGIRFADAPAVSQGRSVQWGEDVGRRGREKGR